MTDLTLDPGDASLWPPLPALPAFARAWRLGTTSYVYPADLLPNVRLLAGYTQDIELLLFESEDQSNLPSPDTIEELRLLALRGGFSYTVHFPIDRKLGSADRGERDAMVAQLLRIAHLVAPLRPHGFILHPEGIDATAAAPRIHAWQAWLIEGVARLLDGGLEARQLCLENLGFPFAWCDPLLARFDLAVCVDTGHLWLQDADLTAHLCAYLPRTRVVHLHGEHQGRDHIALTAMPHGRLAPLLRQLVDYAHVVTLELFNYADTAASITALTHPGSFG